MATCVYCKNETELFENGVAICITCSTQREGKIKEQARTNEVYATLLRDLRAATSSTQTAANHFSAAIAESAHELDEARKRLMYAHTRLNAFLALGKSPKKQN